MVTRCIRAGCCVWRSIGSACLTAARVFGRWFATDLQLADDAKPDPDEIIEVKGVAADVETMFRHVLRSKE